MKYFYGAVVAVALLLALVLPTFASTTARVYVLSGQGGRATSMGMVNLANDLSKNRRLKVSFHVWKNYNDVIRDIWRQPVGTPIIIIGYSLGANATTWISNGVPFRVIDLIVAYDPSVWSVVQPAGLNVRRALLYHNNGNDPLGHARIPGLQVETTETRMAHLAVDFSARLHIKTKAAIERVLEQYP